MALVVEVLAHGLPQRVGHRLVASLAQDAVDLRFHIRDEAHTIEQVHILTAVAQIVVDTVAGGHCGHEAHGTAGTECPVFQVSHSGCFLDVWGRMPAAPC